MRTDQLSAIADERRLMLIAEEAGRPPVRHALTRRIDPRVAGADARLPYPDLPVVPA